MGRENLNMVIALPAVEARKARADQLSCGVARSSILGQRLTIYALRSHGRFTLLSGRVPRRVSTCRHAIIAGWDSWEFTFAGADMRIPRPAEEAQRRAR